MSEAIAGIRRSPYVGGPSNVEVNTDVLRRKAPPEDVNFRGQPAEAKNTTIQDSLNFLAKEAEELHESLCRLAARLQPIRREVDNSMPIPLSQRPPQCEIQACIEGLRERCQNSQALVNALHASIQL